MGAAVVELSALNLEQLRAPGHSGSDSASTPSSGQAPPFDDHAQGNHLEANSRKNAFWGKRGVKLLNNRIAPSYLQNLDDPTIELVVEFFRLREDHNGQPMSNKFGKPLQLTDGWWKLPLRSAEKNACWKSAFHGTKWSNVYCILESGELLESDKYMKNGLKGVYCYKTEHSHKAENFIIFEDVFSNGHWWAAMLELSVNREGARSAGDQWVQSAASVRLQALWVCGRKHAEMHNGSHFFVWPWDPKREVNPFTACPGNIAAVTGSLARSECASALFRSEHIRNMILGFVFSTAVRASWPSGGWLSLRTSLSVSLRSAMLAQVPPSNSFCSLTRFV